MARKIRVLLVDDSALARLFLRSIFESDDAFEVMAEASNGTEAVAQVKRQRPDLISMDLEMPQMRGMAAIEEIMSFRPTPILVVSDYTNAQSAYAAVSQGAVDVVAKPGLSEGEIRAFLERARLVARIPVITHVRALRCPPLVRTAAVPALPRLLPNPERVQQRPIFAIASSTGGPQALAQILSQLPSDFDCAILIAQHVVPGFAAGMAKWLATVSNLPVKLAELGEPIIPGQVYLSPSEMHLNISRNRRVDLQEVRASDVYRPSCNRLLESVALVYGGLSVGIILTGMGSDGAKGMAFIKTAGGYTLAQDESSSVVYGMNRVAIESRQIDRVLPLDEMADAMVRLAKRIMQP
ncbi:MAG: chemotaxis-specific protein-glutamate methyltransferase CheB [Formivibrio sp.]|nr:chemotaxis-specific protein-glutamate methyltransferase CheB [Formivibrio sp.]